MDAGLIALAVAAVGIVPGVTALILQRRSERAKAKKIEAEADTETAQLLKVASEAGELNVKTAMSFIAPLREKIAELEKELKSVTAQLQAIEAALQEKELQIEKLEKESRDKDGVICELQAKIKSLEGEVEYLKRKIQRIEEGRGISG